MSYLGCYLGSGPVARGIWFVSHFFRVQFSHGRVFSDSRNVQKRATKSDISGHCLVLTSDVQVP